MLSFGFLIFIFITFILNEPLDTLYQWQIFINNKSTFPTSALCLILLVTQWEPSQLFHSSSQTVCRQRTYFFLRLLSGKEVAVFLPSWKSLRGNMMCLIHNYNNFCMQIKSPQKPESLVCLRLRDVSKSWVSFLLEM